MFAKFIKIGSGEGIYIPQALIHDGFPFEPGMELTMSIEDGNLIFSPVIRERQKRNEVDKYGRKEK